MKRMNVREFRAKISDLNKEPIEVVRYSETIGFWVPQGMTLEPRTRRYKGMSEVEMRALVKKLDETLETMEGLGMVKK